MSVVNTSNTLKTSLWIRRGRIGQKITLYLFLTPFLAGFLVFMVYPLIYAFNLSLYRKKLVGGTSFVGLDNYVKALQDVNFWDGVRNVLVFGAMQIPVMLGLALLFALLLDGKLIRSQTIFRLGYFLPFAVPSVVAALIWGYFYGQSFGPIAQIATALHLKPPLFLTPTGIIPSIANIATWQYTGYNMLILFAALKGIPGALRSSARGWRQRPANCAENPYSNYHASHRPDRHIFGDRHIAIIQRAERDASRCPNCPESALHSQHLCL
jgi:multiple sugar transport system permease protein